jgi:hypothetical protein
LFIEVGNFSPSLKREKIIDNIPIWTFFLFHALCLISYLKLH